VDTEKQIINEMTKLYLMFTSPIAIIDRETGQLIEMSIKWTNQKAEVLYQEYQEEYQKVLQTSRLYNDKTSVA